MDGEGRLVIGRTLAHYRITAAIGSGGMGEVYRATDTKLGREVALKVLPPAMAASADRLERFRREAKALAALDHPGIVLDEAVKANPPDGLWKTAVLAAAHGQLGEAEAARDTLGTLPVSAADAAQSAREILERWLDAQLVEHVMEGLQKTGLAPPDWIEEGYAHNSTRSAEDRRRRRPRVRPHDPHLRAGHPSRRAPAAAEAGRPVA
jgi:serine/threonine protein kinase